MNIKSIFSEIEQGNIENCLVLLDYLEDDNDDRYNEFYDLIGEFVTELNYRNSKTSFHYGNEEIVGYFQNFINRAKALFWMELQDSPRLYLESISIKVKEAKDWLAKYPEEHNVQQMRSFGVGTGVYRTEYPDGGEGAIGDTR